MDAEVIAALNDPPIQPVSNVSPWRVITIDAGILRGGRLAPVLKRLDRATFRRMTSQVVCGAVVVIAVEEVALTTPQARAAWDAVCDELTVRRLEADQRARR